MTLDIKLPTPANSKTFSQCFDPLIRLPQVLQILPIGKSTWWSWVASGKAPKGIKLGKKTTAWRTSDIQQLLNNLCEEVQEC